METLHGLWKEVKIVKISDSTDSGTDCSHVSEVKICLTFCTFASGEKP